MGHEAVWVGHPVRLELTHKGLLVSIAKSDNFVEVVRKWSDWVFKINKQGSLEL